jgi:L-gulonolactone oxidase
MSRFLATNEISDRPFL